MNIVTIKENNKISKFWNCTLSIFNNESSTIFYLKVNDCTFNIKQSLYLKLLENLNVFNNLNINMDTNEIIIN